MCIVHVVLFCLSATWQTEGVVAVGVSDEDLLDLGGFDSGFLQLQLRGFPAVEQPHEAVVAKGYAAHAWYQ